MTLVWRPGFEQWDPSLISTALWLDAADASTVTTVSGAVSEWRDKSGNNRHATQANSANRPTYSTAAQNGRNVITFDGSNDTINTSTFLFATSSLASCSVFKTSSISSEGIWGGQASTTNRVGLFFTGGTALRSHTFDIGDTEATGYSANQYVIVSTSRAGNSNQQYRNGSLVASSTSTPNSIASLAISIGSFADNTVGSFPGDFAELIIFPSDVLARQKVEGYLAYKWGLTANLPSDHPYKTNAPAP